MRGLRPRRSTPEVVMAWYHRLRNLIRSRRHSTDLDREIAFHVAERTDELMAQGLKPDQAAREARRRFGNRTRHKEEAHNVDVLVWLESVLADLRYAGRALRRSPGFAAVAILSLALGIGANTAIFSLTDAVVLRSLPVRHPEALVTLNVGGRRNAGFTNPLWEQIRDGGIPLAGTAAYTNEEFNLARGGVTQKVAGAMVSGSYFPMMGVRTVAGRPLGPDDDHRGCAGTAVVSEGFADREYGAPAVAVGQVLSVNGHPLTVVGVSDGAFTGVEVGQATSLYVPLCQRDAFDGPGTLDTRNWWYIAGILGRLRPGTPIEQVRSWLATNGHAAFEATLPPRWPASNQVEYLKTRLDVDYAAAGLSDLRDTYASALWVLLAVVGVVLLIACANVANLMLARAAAREREIAIRLAIGAGRGRLIRQFLTESLLVTFIGAALGVLFAQWASTLLVRLLAMGDDLLWVDTRLDAGVLIFTAAITGVTGLLFGIVPAWRGTRVDPHAAMKTGGRSATGSERRHGLGRMLVVGQVALSLVLVAVAALLVGSFRRLVTLDPGFERRGVLLVSADFGNSGFDGARRQAVLADLTRRIRELPGVVAASVSEHTPIGNFFSIGSMEVPGSGRHVMVLGNTGSDGYFGTLQTPILEGRDFGPEDAAGAPPVTIINQAMAKIFFPGADPIGRQIGQGKGIATVVGVTADVRFSSLQEEPGPQAFYPMTQGRGIGDAVVFEIRTAAAAPAPPVMAIRDLILTASPAATLTFGTLDAQVDASLARPRLLATLSGFFGALALILAVIGIYGVISYGVTRRRNEIGIRIALGAAGERVLRMVVGEAGRLVAAGLVVGLVLTLLTTRFVKSFLYGVTPTDPLTLVFAAALLVAAGLGAALLPAWRASRVDPMEVLREE